MATASACVCVCVRQLQTPRHISSVCICDLCYTLWLGRFLTFTHPAGVDNLYPFKRELGNKRQNAQWPHHASDCCIFARWAARFFVFPCPSICIFEDFFLPLVAKMFHLVLKWSHCIDPTRIPLFNFFAATRSPLAWSKYSQSDVWKYANPSRFIKLLCYRYSLAWDCWPNSLKRARKVCVFASLPHFNFFYLTEKEKTHILSYFFDSIQTLRRPSFWMWWNQPICLVPFRCYTLQLSQLVSRRTAIFDIFSCSLQGFLSTIRWCTGIHWPDWTDFYFQVNAFRHAQFQ